jgi:dihydroorotate dehydrogenase
VQQQRGLLGVNVGKNKTSKDAAADYVMAIEMLGDFADYVVVNVSSPNTPGLRSLQRREHIDALIRAVCAARDCLHVRPLPPVLVKIAPDLTEKEKRDIAEVALATGVDGLIVSNTTITRPDTLKSSHCNEAGGLSGRPLMALATETLSDMYRLTGGKVPLIGAGGVADGKDAYAKIQAGASLVQMYSCLAYRGLSCVPKIKAELVELLVRDGFSCVEEAVGSAHK